MRPLGSRQRARRRKDLLRVVKHHSQREALKKGFTKQQIAAHIKKIRGTSEGRKDLRKKVRGSMQMLGHGTRR